MLRKIILALLFLFPSAVFGAPPAVVQSVVSATGQSTHTVQITNLNTSAGNLLVVTAYYLSQAISVNSISDISSNTWTQVANAKSGTSGYQTDIWYSQNSAAISTGYVTMRMSAVGLRVRFIVMEVSGIKTTGALDAGNNLQTTGAMVSPALTPTAPNEILIAIVASNDI